MKNILILIALSFGILISAQVGIGNSDPVRTLDITGNLNVRNVEYKNADPNYKNVLVTNADGEIEFWDKQDIKDKMDDMYVVNKKFSVSTTGPDTDLVVPCGKFQLRYNSPVMPQIKLLTPTGSATTIYYNRIRKRNSSSDGFSTDNGRSLKTNQTVSINSRNSWVNIGKSTDATGDFSNNTLDEYYITYPGDKNLYRITFLARTAGGGNISYSMVCERF